MKKRVGLPERFLLLWILTAVIGHCAFGLSVARICGTSMASAFDDGEYVIVAAVRDCRELQRGDVITFYPATDSRVTYVKRVVGVSGDVLEARGGLLFVNGKSDGFSQPGIGTWGLITVPSDAVFVLGDNRTVSVDSRTIGCIPFSQICAKVVGKNMLL